MDVEVLVTLVGRLGLGHVAVDAAEPDLNVAAPGPQPLDDVASAALVDRAVEDRQDIERSARALGLSRACGRREQGQQENGGQQRQKKSGRSHRSDTPEAWSAEPGV